MNLLFTTSRLSLGGAETHILGLAKELTAMGHTVTIVSAGGKLTKQLPIGISHMTLPLDRKDPLSVVRSLVGLQHILKKEDFSVVHAHARIPAFLCGILQKTLSFRLVTTAHLDFPKKRLGIFSRWGEKTLAVSQDIKDHLIRVYGLAPDNIAVTVNGIDTSHFSPSPSGGRNGNHLLHVSRLDSDRSLTAFCLVAIAEELRRQFPSFRLTILGEGRDLAALRHVAHKLDPAGTYLAVLGGVPDPAPYLREADLFVGVSRAALEAMACGLPVILSGNQGYGGALTPEALPAMAATNLCCRGCPLPTEEGLLREITALLADGDSRVALGAFGRETVLRDYPFARTAADCLALYESLPPRPTTRQRGVLLCGYFGYGNTGDEAILSASLAALRREDPARPITVLTAHPRRVARTYGVRVAGRFDPLAILWELMRCETLVFGGGGLLQDESGLPSLLYYTALLRLGRRMGKQVILHAGGIGPLIRPISQRLTAKALRGVEVTVRDPVSRQRLAAIGFGETVGSAADPALALKPADGERVAHLLRRYGLTAGRYAVLVPREKATAVFPLPVGLTPVLIPFFPAEDRGICLAMQKRLPYAVLMEELSPAEIMGVIGEASLVLGMRLHALIFAQRMGVPCQAVGNHPKLTEYQTVALPVLEQG